MIASGNLIVLVFVSEKVPHTWLFQTVDGGGDYKLNVMDDDDERWVTLL